MTCYGSRAKMMNRLKVHTSLFIYVLLCVLDLSMTNGSPRLLLSVYKVVRVEGTRVQVKCWAKVNEPIQSLKWMAVQKTPFKQEMLDNTTVSLTIPTLHRSDAGIYRCMLITVDGEEETEEFKLYVRPKITDRGGLTCRVTQFKCKVTKDCIFTRYRCDGKDDCGDGSDEDCAVDPCENKFRCNNSRCVKWHELCDHVDNCGDGSDEQASCYEGRVPTTEGPKDSSSLSLPKRTIFVIIASIIAAVILICFIVILGCRAKMKRQRREGRLMSSMTSARRLQEVPETPRSPSQAEETSGEGQPFLLNANQPYWIRPNIIVNVNNGVQYMPQYECPMRSFMEAPPPYSEVRSSHEGSENAPPPYSTLRQEQTPDWHAANQNTDSNCPDRQHSSDRSAINDRRGLAHEHGSISHDSGGPTQENENSAFVSSQVDSHLDPFQNVSSHIGDSGALSSPRDQMDNEAVSDTGQRPPECSGNIHEASTIQSRPRSCLVQASEGQFDTSAPEASGCVAVSSFSDRPQSMTDPGTDMTTSLGDGSVSVPLSDGANVQSSSFPLNINSPMNQLPSSPTNRHEHANTVINPSSHPGHTSPNNPATNNSHNLADPVPASVSENQNTSPSHPTVGRDLEGASCALLQEVSRRDDRNKPQPGHLSVQGGQIVLHTDNGVIAGQTVIPTVGGAGPSTSQGQGSDQPSTMTSQLGGEIVVKDGVIMLQIPVSQLILNQQNVLPSPSIEPAIDNAQTSAEEGPEQECNATPSPSPPTSLPEELTFKSASDSPVTSMPSQGVRLCGDLNIRDGQIVLEPPRHTPSSQILSHLQGAYCQEESDPLLGESDDRLMEPVGNTKRTSGQASGGRHVTSKCNSDFVLSHGKDYQSSL